jgi:uncharacterized membrane protein
MNEKEEIMLDGGQSLMVVLFLVVSGEIVAVCICRKGWNNNALKLVGFTVVGFLAVLAGIYVDIPNALTAVYALMGAIVGGISIKTSATERSENKADEVQR